MSDHDATSQGPTLTNGGIAEIFLSNPLAVKSNDDTPVDSSAEPTLKTWLDEPITNDHKNDDETNNLTNGSSFLDVPPTSDDKSEHSVKGDSHANENLNEEIQKAMAGVINDMQSSSTTSAGPSRVSRHSNASQTLAADDTKHSEPLLNEQQTNLDPASNGTHQEPVQSASEPSTTLPIRKDESSSDTDDHYGISAASTNNKNNNDDPFDGINEQSHEQKITEPSTHDEFFDTKTATVEDEQRAASPAKSNILDETTRFTTGSPKSSTSRAPSTTSKRSVRATPDDLSTHNDEKKISKSAEETGTETDRENQEVTEIARRPSVARSPVDRPGSPTPDDSVRPITKTASSPSTTPQDQQRTPSPPVTHDKPPATNELPRMSPIGDQSKSPSPVLMQRRSPVEEGPVETAQSSSRPASTTILDQKSPSRMSTTSKDKPDSKTVSPVASRRGSDHVQESAHPTVTDHTVETTITSPPSSPKINGLVKANPLLDDQSEQNGTVKHASPTPSQDSRGKVLDSEPVHAPTSRRESQVDRTPAKPSSPQSSGSRRTSQAHEVAVPEIHDEQTPTSRRSSKLSQGPSDDHITVTVEPPTPQVDEIHTRGQLGHSRQPSTASVKQVSSKRSSVTSEKVLPVTTHDSATDEPKLDSKRSSVASEQRDSDRRESFHDASTASGKRASPDQHVSTSDARKSVTHQTKTPTPPPATVQNGSRQPSRRSSEVVEPKKASRPASVADDHQDEGQKSNSQHEATPSNKRVSTVSDHLGFNPNAGESKLSSRRESTNETPGVTSKRASNASEHAPSVHHSTGGSRRESTQEETHVPSKRGSNVSDHPVVHYDDHTNGSENKGSSRHGSGMEASHEPSRRTSTAVDHVHSSRQSSAKEEPKMLGSKRQSTAVPSNAGSRRNSDLDNQHNANQHHFVASDSHPPSKRQSIASEHPHASPDEDSTPTHKNGSRRESHRSDRPTTFNRQMSSDDQDQKPTSKAPSRKQSFVEHAPVASRRESQNQQVSSSRASDHDEKQSTSPHYLTVADAVPSKQSSRRSSDIKTHDETPKGSSRSRAETVNGGHDVPSVRPVSGHVSSGSRYSSSNGALVHHRDTYAVSDSSPKDAQPSDLDSPTRRVSKSKHDRTASHDHGSQSPSTDQGNEKRYTAHTRSSGQNSKRGSHVHTEETIVVPLSLDSTRSRAKSTRSAAESENEQGSSSRLPPVNGIAHRTDQSHKGALPASHNRKDYKPLSASNSSTPTEVGGKGHWTTNVIVPPLDMSIDDLSASRVDHERPKSPNVEQIAERNLPSSPLIASTAKTRDSTDIHKKKGEKRGSRRDNNSADESVTHIRIVDDKSLDSNSEHEIEFERHKGRRYKPKKRDFATNTETYTPYAHRNVAGGYQDQRYYTDDPDSSSKQPMKATKPMPEHLHGARRRGASREHPMSTPETLRDGETPVVRRVVKNAKESTQNKDPVNVNVTVVVKKFASSGRERSSNVTTEAYVDERSTPSPPPPRHQQAAVTHQEIESARPETEQQSARELTQDPSEMTTNELAEEQPTTVEEQERYFETVSPPPEATEEPAVNDDEGQVDESNIRPSSTDHAHSATSKKVTLFEDRATQSDTEQSKPEIQKRRLRPKRISRTCQTYEHVFRRMEREQQQELRAVTDSDKNVQTRKSQLRPRKKSPKKDQSMYLSADSFRVEDLLPSHFHQSRRNVSKSSVVARSLSPQGGKLLILRPTLPFHHTDAVNVHRVCLQYAIDLVPSDNPSSGSPPTHRIKSSVHQQSDSLNSLPMIRSASPVTTSASTKSRKKEKSASHHSEEHHHHHHHRRKHSGAH